ncbi:hypothetical protein ES705_27388 [subsurface metagenome]
MNILGRELGKKFEQLYAELDSSGKSIEFMPLSNLTMVSQQDLRGARHTDPLNPNKAVIYLDKNLSDEEFELTAVHELCHELTRLQGIHLLYRVESIDASLRPLVLQEAARLTNCFSHISVCLCMKEHGYEIVDYDRKDLDRIREFISQRKKIDKSMYAGHAIEYISYLYRQKFDCATINVSKMAELYKEWYPEIIKTAERLLRQIPEVNITSAIGCYQATKALRDAVGNEYSVNLASIIKLRNPDTGQPE